MKNKSSVLFAKKEIIPTFASLNKKSATSTANAAVA